MSSINIYGAFPTTTNGPFHYLYRITNLVEQKHYYGSRTSNKIQPQKDLGIKYFSSSRDKEFQKDQQEHPENYRYKIIIVSTYRKKIIDLEIKIHQKFSVGSNQNFYNITKQTSTGFDTSGKIVAKDEFGEIMTICSDHPKFLSGEYQHHSKNTKWISNIETQVSKMVSKNEPTPEGWVCGRKKAFKHDSGYKVIYNKETQEEMRIQQNDTLPSGWTFGRNDINSFRGKKWINNKELGKSKQINRNDPLPPGWQFGIYEDKGITKWIHNKELGKNKRIPIETSIPEGWVIGRNTSSIPKGSRKIINIETKEHTLLKPDELLPKGWIFVKN